MAGSTEVRTAVLGIGNLLLGDEGVGVHVVQEIMKTPLPPGTAVIDLGSSILDAVPWFEAAARVIIIDAMRAGNPPGTVYKVPLADCEPALQIASLHGFDLTRTLAPCGASARPEVVVIGIEPEIITWSLELSPTVSASLPAVLSEVTALCK